MYFPRESGEPRPSPSRIENEKAQSGRLRFFLIEIGYGIARFRAGDILLSAG
jgi:hypothetical protein